MYKGGYDEQFRRSIITKVVNVYSEMLDKHKKGNIMYKEDSVMKNKKNPLWFK